jgi:hypothetical protein
VIRNEDISVVVQGPVQSRPDRPQDEGITRHCLRSVRQFLPGARLILSTWPGQDLDGLDFDDLVINEDPGRNIVGYDRGGAPRYENTNRQIVSTAGGLRRVQTRYAMKLRADNFLTGDGFKALQQRYPARAASWQWFRERVVVTNTLARRYYRGRRVAFFLSDFFAFGLTDDVRNLWDLPLFPDFPFDEARRGRMQHPGAPMPRPDVDQQLVMAFLGKQLGRPFVIRHVFDTANGLPEQSDLFFANNFVVADPARIGLGLPTKFAAGREAKLYSRATCMAPAEWQLLYRRHCDPRFRAIEDRAWLRKVRLVRAFVVPMKRAGSALRSWRDALAGSG